MSARTSLSKFAILGMSVLLMMSCLLPGMIPLKSAPTSPMPVMETNVDAVIEVLSGDGWRPLQALAQEQYTEEDFAGPGTLDFTVTIADEAPTYFSYGWCAVDEETLRQNVEHIAVSLYFNEDALGKDVVHTLSFISPNDRFCLDFGVLLSEWAPGKYDLKAVASFDEKINDGLADYAAGDYIFEYHVTVDE